MSLDINSVRLIMTGLTMSIGAIMPGFAIALIGARAVEAIGRNPEASSRIQTMALLAIVFAEAIAIYALVVALILKFVP